MKRHGVRVGEVWREPSTGRVVEVLEVTQGELNASVRIRNVDTGKVTWRQAWTFSVRWQRVQEAAA